MVLNRQSHSLTAYNLLFKYTRSNLLHSTSITDNDAVAAFPSPRMFFDTLNLPSDDRTDKKKRPHNNTHWENYISRSSNKYCCKVESVITREEEHLPRTVEIAYTCDLSTRE